MADGKRDDMLDKLMALLKAYPEIAAEQTISDSALVSASAERINEELDDLIAFAEVEDEGDVGSDRWLALNLARGAATDYRGYPGSPTP